MRQRSIEKEYGGRSRIRVCGIYVKEESILLVNHTGLNKKDNLWIPPGGGLHSGETIHHCLKREFYEETNLEVDIGAIQCVAEFVDPPLHAVELFFKIENVKGIIKKGVDPEFGQENQIIKSVAFMTFAELMEIPDSEKHGLLRNISNAEALWTKTGYFKLP